VSIRIDKHLIASLIVGCIALTAQAQRLAFKHIGAEQGVTNVASWSCTTDKFGFIWMASIDGLIRYDGKKIQYYRTEEYPELTVDHVDYVFCDSRNNLWACNQFGLVRIDENRIFTRQRIVDSLESINVDACFEGRDGSIYALTSKGAYALAPGQTGWQPQLWLDSIMQQSWWRNIIQFDSDRTIVVIPSRGVFLINTTERKLDVMFPIIGAYSCTRFDEESILIGKADGFELLRVFIHHPDSVLHIKAPLFFNKEYRHAQISRMVRAIDGAVYMATSGAGLVILDSSLQHYALYTHDPLNPHSITSNSLRNVYTDKSGLLIITSLDGANYTNVTHNATEYINYLRTNDGQILNERVLSMAGDHNNKLWICFVTNVFLYDLQTRECSSMNIPPGVGLRNDGLSPVWVECDKQGRIWIALKDDGILLFNKDYSFNRLITYPTTKGSIKAINRPRVMKECFDGYMYVGTESGLVRIDLESFELDTFADLPVLQPLLKKRIVDILPSHEGLWVSSSPKGAAWHYSYADNQLKSYSKPEGLPTDRIYGLTTDQNDNIYIGSFEGFSLLYPNDSIVNWTKGHGLIATRVESIETDRAGNVWIANSYNLLKYDPAQKLLSRIGARYGLMNINFVVMSSTVLPSGKIVFGANKGFLMLDPTEIKIRNDSLKLHVFYKDRAHGEIDWTGGNRLVFNYGKSQPQFFFAVSDIMVADQVLYKYRLNAREESSWSDPSYNSGVNFNLDPGHYSLEVMAFDGEKWFSIQQPVEITVRPPWWKQWWFIALLIFIVGSGLWYYLRVRIEKYKKELFISRHIADLESRALRAQMNPHFVFNSLNAIQECIVTGKVEEAYMYLSRFSRLLRLVLEHSDMPDVSLMDELEVLDLYVSLEKLRFKNEMTYRFELGEEVDAEEIRVPPMLIQPHLENAIWHGLRHKAGPKQLTLTIHEENDNYLTVIVEDNGIGRAKAAELKASQIANQRHASKGRVLSENRMELLKKNYPLSLLTTTDLYKEGLASGTRVMMKIPILNNAKNVIPA
jgi:ligand-binding sensor domain-containing protein